MSLDSVSRGSGAQDTWLIALSAYHLPAQAASAGFDEYFTKPRQPSEACVRAAAGAAAPDSALA